jgi:hypothetical protein
MLRILLLTVVFFIHMWGISAQPLVYPVVIAGGGASGTMAAIQCARSGVPVLLIEETPWLGGMLTAAGVSAIDGNHRLPSGLWGEFRDSLYARYGGPAAVETGWVSNTLFEPAVAQAILRNMVAREPLIRVMTQTSISHIRYESAKWTGLVTNSKGSAQGFTAQVLIDATELGDVLHHLGLPRDIGMDSREHSGEPQAPLLANDIVQDLTWVATLKDFGPGANKTIPRPEGYNPADFACCCDPTGSNTGLIDCKKMLDYGRLPNGKYMINWPNCGNDFYLNLISATPDQRKALLKQAKLHTLRFVYYIQHELGFRHLGLADDEYPTTDLLPLIPYHRESGRIKGLVRLTVNHLVDPFGQTEPLYRTGIAVGDYPIDHHHKKNPAAPDIDFIQIRAASYNIPLGALIPNSHPNLIVAEKSISISNIVNGATRLQPVVLGIGQAAGALAALSARQRRTPASIPVREVQQELLQHGAYLMPYLDVPHTDPHFVAIQQIGATGILKGTGIPYKWANQTWFYPDKHLTEYELLEGLRSYYTALDNRRDASGAPLQLPYLQQLLTAVRPDITAAVIQKVWSDKGLGNPLTDKHHFTRRELAVLLQTILNPFDIPVNYSGLSVHKPAK